MKKSTPVLHCDKTLQTVENSWEMLKTNTRLWLVFSTYLLHVCSQMPAMFYHSVIHSLGFFIC